MNDPTATVLLSVTDANGNTSGLSGLTGRDGNFWVPNVQFSAGSNQVSLTLSTSAGITTTNFTVIGNDFPVSINSVSAGDTVVSGTIGTNGYAVWANGIQAMVTNGTWQAQIIPIGIGGGVVNVTAVPTSGGDGANGATQNMFEAQGAANPQPPQSMNTQATVQPPQGVFNSMYRVSDLQIGADLGGGSLAFDQTAINFQDGGAGDYAQFLLYWWDKGSLYHTDWQPFSWPAQCTDSEDSTIYGLINSNDWSSLMFAQTNIGVGGPPPLGSEHCDFNTTLYYQDIFTGNNIPYETWQRDSDAEVKLATGGPLGSTQQNLWVLNVNASDYLTGAGIPYSQISVGNFGTPDTNGDVYAALPDNDPDVIALRVSGTQNYGFGIRPTKYTLEHHVGCVAPGDANSSRTTIGIREVVTFSGMPAGTTWSVSGGGNIQTNFGSVEYYAPASRTMATITATYKSAKVSVNFTVIPPSSIIATSYRNLPLGDQDNNGTEMGESTEYTDFFGPTNVSFNNVNFRELQSSATYSVAERHK